MEGAIDSSGHSHNWVTAQNGDGKSIGYLHCGVCGVPREAWLRDGEHWNARIIRETAEAEQAARKIHALHTELNEAADVLAEGLGYTHDALYGWIVGDHTTVTLAMEARRELKEARNVMGTEDTVRIPRSLYEALGCAEKQEEIASTGITLEVVEDAD